MPSYFHTEGICLRRFAYSNTSQVASFITPDAGRLTFLAKGVTRAPKRGIRTGFDLLGRYELVYTRRRYGSLHNLTYRWLRDGLPDLRRSLEPLLCGYYAAELALNFSIEGDPCPVLYPALVAELHGFAAAGSLGAGVLRLELAALEEHGSCPTFDACAECGEPLPPRGPVCFSPLNGGPLCARCEGELSPHWRRHTTTVGADQLHGLAAASSGESDAAPLPPERIVAMSAILRFHIRSLLGRELRMWKYLQQRHLSRSLREVRRSGT